MKQRIITIALIGGCLVLGLVALLIKGTRDTKPPVITVGKETLTYTQGEDYSLLLADVTAEDNKDKDISDSIFIERIVDMDNGEQATVIYAVMDSSKNVATAKRVINYTKTTAGTNPEITPDANPNGDPNADQQPEGTTQGLPEIVANGELPVIQLKTNTITVPAGQGFDPLSVVNDAVDNKDTREQLFQHIHADGIYDTNVPGTYILQYYVTDQENNPSNIEAFTLVVQ